MKKQVISIVGAGISGLSCALKLLENGFSVNLYEKESNVGGRMDCLEYHGTIFDHGAQYFTSRSEEFNEFIADRSYIREWSGDIKSMVISNSDTSGGVEYKIDDLNNQTKRYVGDPNVGFVCRNLLDELERVYGDDFLFINKKVCELKKAGKGWILQTNENQIEDLYCDSVVLTGTPRQIMRRVPNTVEFYETLKNGVMKPVIALMLKFEESQNLPFDAAFVNHTYKITWMCRENSKRSENDEKIDGETWIVHYSPDYSLKHCIYHGEKKERELLSIAQECLEPYGLQFNEDELYLKSVFVWKESDIVEPLEIGFLYDDKLNIGVATDWINNKRVEGGFLSGHDLAKYLIDK